jgi:hypothetical protein
MITQAIIQVFQAIINGILNILPSGTSHPIPSQITDAFSLFAGFFQKAEALFPMDTVFTIIGLTFLIEGSILVFNIADWLYDKIRG